MPCGLFEDFGFFGFGEDPSPAEAIYNTLIDAYGREGFSTAPGSYHEARCYATAMLFGEALNSLRRARNQLQPATVSDKLDEMEADYKVTPDYGDSDDVRRARLVALKLLMRGAREEAITNALIAELGSDFIGYHVHNGDAVAIPADPSTVGTFPAPDATPKFYQLGQAVDRGTRSAILIPVNASEPPLAGEKLTIEAQNTGLAEAVTVLSVANTWLVPATLRYGHLSGKSVFGSTGKVFTLVSSVSPGNITLSLVAANGIDKPLAGEILILDNDSGTAETITIASATPQIVISATFAKAHDDRASVMSACPLWHSTQREVLVVMTASALLDPEKRRKANRVMARHSKAVTRWYLVAQSTAGQVGPFLVGSGRIGVDAVGTLTF